ncbi:hypothetical protein GGX14DRAFT_578605 [Mycena pura]|uniref:Uncharacterized protein n=1 Tax=Mycena pura TaxID=153505 RepID=A0AAD6XZD6_9AGAR|nr:hypothetical protein GGX14DRAFT_578605 [Mycena pura]
MVIMDYHRLTSIFSNLYFFRHTLGVVPKPQSEKLRMVVDHSFGEFSPNLMIPREAIAGAKLDSLKHLGDRLLELRRRHAYQRLPMHPLWQMKQTVIIDGQRHVVTISVIGALHGMKLPQIRPHIEIPQSWTPLLWDEIGIPHEGVKQVSGETLTVIGFEVDCAAMTFTMADSKCTELIDGVKKFMRMPPSGSRRRSLREYQQLAGWIIWALNVHPLLRPGLSNVYDKTRAKERSNTKIFVSKAVARDLSWFIAHLEHSNGVRLLEEQDWEPRDTDVTVYYDASFSGLGFFLDGCDMAFQARPPAEAPQNSLALEAFCVCWALHEDTVDIFSSLSAKPLYNKILKSAVDVLLPPDNSMVPH